MSVLIAYKKGDTVYLGTDTRVIVGDLKKNETSECNYKIQKQENGMLVGVVADRATRQTILAYSDIFTLDKKGELNKRHIVTEIIPKLISVLENEGLIVERENKFPIMEADILLVHKGEIYHLFGPFSVLKYEDYQLIGSVSQYGGYIIETTKESDDINERIVKALDVMAKNSHYVGRPYLLINTEDMEYKLIK